MRIGSSLARTTNSRWPSFDSIRNNCRFAGLILALSKSRTGAASGVLAEELAPSTVYSVSSFFFCVFASTASVASSLSACLMYGEIQRRPLRGQQRHGRTAQAQDRGAAPCPLAVVREHAGGNAGVET